MKTYRVEVGGIIERDVLAIDLPWWSPRCYAKPAHAAPTLPMRSSTYE